MPVDTRTARCLAAGFFHLVGVAAISFLIYWLDVLPPAEGWRGLGQLAAVVAWSALGMIPLVGPILWLLEVKPAWPVVLLGPVCAADLMLAFGLGPFLLAVPGGYAVAGWVTAPGRGRTPVVGTAIALGVFLVALAVHLADGEL